jgi:light-regulated signal transduction histidine kinase (bacteriophytochrome)
LQKVLSEARGYGLAVLSVSAALGAALLLDSYGFSDVAIPLLLFALGIVVWYGGPGPAVLALVLSSFGFNYFFTEPLYSLYITPADLPQFVISIVFASLFTWFSTVRRRTEQKLLLSQVELEKEVKERTLRAEEVRALNHELEKRGRELEASNKELEAFAYSVSHDLRAPLRHMVGFTALLQKGASSRLDDKSQRYVTMILESAKRMGTLIDDLLAFSRIGRAETHKTTVSLQQLVQEALAEVQQETEGRNIVWSIGTLPTWYGDRSMLRLVLVNLISNAVKFTRTRPQAEIQVACTEQEPDSVVVCIRDNGVGFDMQYVNKLFGVFQRLHAAEAFEGTGIGLATVQRIVHRHGGRVWAEGSVDKGAVFYFSLSKPRGA